MARKYKKRKPTRWNDAIKKFLADNAGILSDKQIADALSRITGSTYTRNSVLLARHRFTNTRKLPGRSPVKNRAFQKNQEKGTCNIHQSGIVCDAIDETNPLKDETDVQRFYGGREPASDE